MPYSPLSLAPARTAAATLVDRLDLQPPVQVHDLVRERADLEKVDWPGESVDAIMLRRGTDKPRVFYKAHDPRGLRERFTLGHELGHLVLPWQIGNTTCVVSDDVQVPINSDEAEANMFASCLLAPDTWLRSLLEGAGTDMSSLLLATAEAEISSTATLLALRRVLTAGWAFQLNAQTRAFLSVGTKEPQCGGTSLRVELGRKAKADGAVTLHGQRIRWWRLTEDHSLPDCGGDGIPLRDLLKTAIQSYAPIDMYKRIEQSANGIVGGGARDLAGRPAGEIYASLRYRFAQSARSELLAAPEFEVWLARKAHVIASKGRTAHRRGLQLR